MRTIVTAFTAAALALSLTFQAGTAIAAVPGYDSSYAGESAFLNLDQGDTGSFTVFFANTGTTTWTQGSATQVDLATCLEDKTTCNAQDSDEATFNDGWLSATRYATHTQTSVAPGQIGTYTYDVTVPSDAAADTYRFNGALVLASTGVDIHNEGYFQDVTVAGGPPAGDAATLTKLSPTSGTNAGGTTVTITGTDFVCTPSFPTADFGGAAATVTACGSTTLTVTTPAHDVGAVDVTVTNTGAAASNALTFTYKDTTKPTFDSITAEGNTITLTFSEPVCTDTGTLDADGADNDAFNADDDVRVRVNGSNATISDIDFTDCDDGEDATATVTVSSPSLFVAGDTVSLTIQDSGADKILDAADNKMDIAQTRTTTATADTTAPTASSASVSALDTITVKFNEGVWCDGSITSTGADDFAFTNQDGDVIKPTSISGCGTSATATKTSLKLNFAAGKVDAGDTGTLDYTSTTALEVKDASGNELDDFSDLAVTALSTAQPTIDDAKITTNAGFASTADSGDVFKLTFSGAMDTTLTDNVIRVQDGDGTIADIKCTGAPAPSDTDNILDASCTLGTSDTVLTVTLREDSAAGTSGATTADPTNLIALGDSPGLQWPATIIDTSGMTDQANDQQPNLGNSADVVIDNE